VKVSAAPLPLTSLADDVAALNRSLDRTEGPIILAGHAYAGAVMALARPQRVKALVYVTALAPDEREKVADVFYRLEPHPKAPKLAPDSNDASVIERDIQPAELFHDRADRFLHGALIRNVSWRDRRSPARFRDLPRYRLKFGHPSSNQGYGSSLAPKCEGGSPADPASGTCNQGDPAGEPFRIVPYDRLVLQLHWHVDHPTPLSRLAPT
jgi:pimeloyl-ACP methyl ester carboxylesterase